MRAKERMMAEEKKTVTKSEVKETKSEAEPAPVAAEESTVKSTPPWALVTIGVVVTIVIAALVIMSWVLVMMAAHKATPQRTDPYGFSSQDQRSQNNDGGRMFGRGGMRGGTSLDVVARGVVTAVNGDTITVSGQGKQVTVKKTDDTVIGGDKSSVAVNDSVIVTGDTGSDGTVTASRIRIQNEDFMDTEDLFDSMMNAPNI